MIKNKIILIGGGGHCKSCIDVIEAENKYDIVGIVDTKDKIGQKVLGYPVITSDEELPVLVKEYKNFLITIGQVKSSKLRTDKFNELKKLGAVMPVIVSPKARVSRTAIIAEGTIIMHDSIVNSESKIGSNCIINNKCLIEHEAIIGDNTHVSTGAIVNGQCEVGSNVFLGSGSVLANNIKVVSNAIVGAGTIVTRSITEEGTYIGNPAKRLK